MLINSFCDTQHVATLGNGMAKQGSLVAPNNIMICYVAIDLPGLYSASLKDKGQIKALSKMFSVHNNVKGQNVSFIYFLLPHIFCSNLVFVFFV